MENSVTQRLDQLTIKSHDLEQLQTCNTNLLLECEQRLFLAAQAIEHLLSSKLPIKAPEPPKTPQTRERMNTVSVSSNQSSIQPPTHRKTPSTAQTLKKPIANDMKKSTATKKQPVLKGSFIIIGKANLTKFLKTKPNFDKVFQFFTFKEVLHLRFVNKKWAKSLLKVLKRVHYGWLQERLNKLKNHELFKNTEEYKAEIRQKADKAKQQVQSLDKRSIDEMRLFSSPAKDIVEVLNLVCIIFDHKHGDWSEMRKIMFNFNQFMANLMNLDIENLPENKMLRIEKLVADNNLSQRKLLSVSLAATHLFLYIEGIIYVYREKNPLDTVDEVNKKQESANKFLALTNDKYQFEGEQSGPENDEDGEYEEQKVDDQ